MHYQYICISRKKNREWSWVNMDLFSWSTGFHDGDIKDYNNFLVLIFMRPSVVLNVHHITQVTGPLGQPCGQMDHLRITNCISGTNSSHDVLTHWGRVTHICICTLTIIASDNGLSPGQRQAIIWTNDGVLLIRSLETNFSMFSEILIGIKAFSFKKLHLKTSSAKWHLFCLGLNELKHPGLMMPFGKIHLNHC